MKSRLVLACSASLVLSVLAVAPAVRAEDPRVVVVVEGADLLIDDLRHLCVDLAEMQEEWENNVLPNIDIYLFGVDPTRPIRFDRIIGGETGFREQLNIPIANLNNFIANNLVPIGINVRNVPGLAGWYSLNGVYNGWMCVEEQYASIADQGHPDDVTTSFNELLALHAGLLSDGYDAAAQLDNSLTTPEQRIAAFAPYRRNTLAGIQKRPAETEAQFAFRRLKGEQSLEMTERVFVDASLVTFGVTLDSFRDTGIAKFILEAEPDTSLADTIQRQAQQHSRFAGVPQAKESILSGRINFALGEMSTRHLSEFYRLLKTPWEQRIDQTEGLTDSQRTVRREIAGIVLDLLTNSLDVGRCDGMIQITPDADGRHTALLGCCAKETAAVAEILKRLPDSHDGCESELDVDAAGEVAIHKLTVTDGYPQAFAEFFGESGEVYVGAGPDSIWLCVGADPLTVLHAGVEAAGKAPAGEPNPTVARLDVNVLPVLQLMDRLRDDGDFDLQATLAKTLGVLEERPSADEDNDGEDADVDTAQMLSEFEWRDAAIEALVDDWSWGHVELKRVDDRLEGEATVEFGVLKAIGALIAKFAKDNLG